MKTRQELMKEIGPQLIAFAQDLIRIKSYTCHEKDAVYRVKEEMEKLNFDQVIIDSIGSVVGIIGNGLLIHGAVKITMGIFMDAVLSI